MLGKIFGAALDIPAIEDELLEVAEQTSDFPTAAVIAIVAIAVVAVVVAVALITRAKKKK